MTEERKKELRKMYAEALNEIQHREVFSGTSALKHFIDDHEEITDKELDFLMDQNIDLFEYETVEPDDALKLHLRDKEVGYEYKMYVIKEHQRIKIPENKYMFFGPSLLFVQETGNQTSVHETYVDDAKQWKWIKKLIVNDYVEIVESVKE